MKDEYDYPRELARTEMQNLKAKEQEKPFSQRCRTWGGFNLPKDVLGENPVLPHRTPKPQTSPSFTQEIAFKPAKPARRGHSCTFAKFPEHMSEPMKFTVRKQLVEGEEVPPSFRSTTRFKSRPSPSVITNIRNLKSSFPSVFR